MKRIDHNVYNKALLLFQNGQKRRFSQTINSLELTQTERGLLFSLALISNELWVDSRNLLLNLNLTSSHFLNGERAMLLGHCYSKLHDSDKTRMSYSAALKEYRLCNDRKGLFLCHLLLGRNLLLAGLYPLALTNLFEAEKLAVGVNENTMVCRYLAHLYSKSGNMSKALIFVERVLLNSKHLSPSESDQMKKMASQVYASLGQKGKAQKIIDELSLKKPSRAH